MRIALAVLVAVAVTYTTHSTPAGVATGLLLWIALSWRLIRGELAQRGRWWSEPNLVAAFTNAGILSAPKKGERPPTLGRRGKPQTTEAGTTVIVELPPGIPHTAVSSKQPQLASAMRVPLAKLIVSHEPTDPAGAVRLWVGAKDQPTHAKHERSRLATAKHTTWWEPVVVGRDARGQTVEWGTAEHNSIVAGVPGSGKTTMGRLPIGHYLLDPSTLIYGLDGKGSRDDYDLVADLAVTWVWGTDDDPATDTLAMFTDLLGIVQDRNRAGGRKKAKDYDGVLLILEEYQDIRAAADKATRENLDATLGRVIRMGRRVGFHVLISTQRPSVEDFPSGQRNLIDHRACLMVRNGADASLVLGHTPTFPLPTRRGDAVVALPDRDRQVVVDYLSDDDWEALCKRAKKVRRGSGFTRPTAAGSTTPDDTETLTTEAPAPVLSPLEEAVVDILTNHPDGLSAAKILNRLPPDIAPQSATALGKALGQSGVVEAGKVGGARLWRPRSPAGVNRPV